MNDHLKLVGTYLLARLSEKTTAAGFALLMGSVLGWSVEVDAALGLLIAAGAGAALMVIPSDLLVKVKNDGSPT